MYCLIMEYYSGYTLDKLLREPVEIVAMMFNYARYRRDYDTALKLILRPLI